MRFRLHKLVSGPVGKVQHEFLDSGPIRFDADLTVHYLRGSLTFTRLPESIMVTGTINTATTVQCVRSLEDFDLCLSATLADIFFTLPALPAEEPDRVVTDEGWLDLTETLRQEIVMAIPFDPVNPALTGDDGPADDALADSKDWLTVRWHDRTPEE